MELQWDVVIDSGKFKWEETDKFPNLTEPMQVMII